MTAEMDNRGIDPITSANSTIAYELEGLQILKEALNGSLKEPFLNAVDTISSASGRLIVTGMGKSGHIARKLAATLALHWHTCILRSSG